MKVDASLEGLLSWRCGYATGLQVALQVMSTSKEPVERVKREMEAATVEASRAWKSARDPGKALN